MHDLTVACAFMFPERERSIRNTLIYNKSNTAPLSHGSHVFEAIDLVVLALPYYDEKLCSYQCYQGSPFTSYMCVFLALDCTTNPNISVDV